MPPVDKPPKYVRYVLPAKVKPLIFTRRLVPRYLIFAHSYTDLEDFELLIEY